MYTQLLPGIKGSRIFHVWNCQCLTLWIQTKLVLRRSEEVGSYIKRRERAAKFSTLTKNSTLDLQMNIFKKILHKIRNKQADKPKQEPVILGYFSGHSTPQISVQREHSMYRVNAGYLSEAEINAHKVPQNGRASMFAGAAPPTCLGSPIQFARPGAGGFPETGLDSSQPFRAADAMYFNLQRLEMTGGRAR